MYGQSLGDCNMVYIHRRIRTIHDDVIKFKHFPRYWSFVRGIHQSLVNSPHKGQGRRALMFFCFFFIYARVNGWVSNRDAGDLRRHSAHYDVIVMPPGLCNYTANGPAVQECHEFGKHDFGLVTRVTSDFHKIGGMVTVYPNQYQ